MTLEERYQTLLNSSNLEMSETDEYINTFNLDGEKKTKYIQKTVEHVGQAFIESFTTLDRFKSSKLKVDDFLFRVAPSSYKFCSAIKYPEGFLVLISIGQLLYTLHIIDSVILYFEKSEAKKEKNDLILGSKKISEISDHIIHLFQSPKSNYTDLHSIEHISENTPHLFILRRWYFQEILFFCLGHEIAHAFLDHFDSINHNFFNKKSKLQELEADKYSAVLLFNRNRKHTINGSTLGDIKNPEDLQKVLQRIISSIILFFYSEIYIELSKNLSVGNHSHPTSQERLDYILNSFIINGNIDIEESKWGEAYFILSLLRNSKSSILKNVENHYK